MWIDRFLELVPGERAVAVKNVSLAEDVLHDHFPSDSATGQGALPIFPACFVVEGMAQTAGILVGHARRFQEKVILAKVNRLELEYDATPGTTLRYTATISRMDDSGAATKGIVELIQHTTEGESTPVTVIGHIDMMFSHIDNNRSGLEFPEHNFVFSDAFRLLLESSGFDVDFVDSAASNRHAPNSTS